MSAPTFFTSGLCVHRKVCKQCRSIVDPTFRHATAKRWRMSDKEFACPVGHPMGYVPLIVTAKPVPAAAVVSRAATLVLPSAVPRDQWPMTLRILARLASEAEQGVGDTIKRQLSIGGKDAIEWVMKALKIPCGCDDRRAWLNARYPYKSEEVSP